MWHFGEVLGCVLLLVAIKFLIVAMVMKSFGFSWEASALAGACMAQVGDSLRAMSRASHPSYLRLVIARQRRMTLQCSTVL